MTTPPTPQPQPAPLPERVQESESGALLAQLDAIPSALRRSHHDAQLEHHDAILKQVIELSRRGIAALAAAEAERDALRAALERIEGEAVVFEVCYRGALRDMDGWHGPLAPEDSTSMGIMPAITAALGGQS